MKKLIVVVILLLAGCGDPNYVEPVVVEGTKIIPNIQPNFPNITSSNFIPYK